MKVHTSLYIGLLIIILSAVLVVLGFYWFEWRPTQIRIKCNNTKIEDYGGHTEEYFYRKCLREYGLNE